jgi:hypothetical protein
MNESLVKKEHLAVFVRICAFYANEKCKLSLTKQKDVAY